MRVRREGKGKEIIVNCSADIEAPLPAITDDVTLQNLMNDYGIPISVEMATKAFKAIMADFKRAPNKNKTYTFHLVCKDITEDD